MKGTMSEEKKIDKEIVEILKQRIGFTTQREFAKQVGMSEKNLSDVLYGRRRPQRNLCEFLGVSRIEKSELLKRLQSENSALKAENERLRGDEERLKLFEKYIHTCACSDEGGHFAFFTPLGVVDDLPDYRVNGCDTEETAIRYLAEDAHIALENFRNLETINNNLIEENSKLQAEVLDNQRLKVEVERLKSQLAENDESFKIFALDLLSAFRNGTAQMESLIRKMGITLEADND